MSPTLRLSLVSLSLCLFGGVMPGAEAQGLSDRAVQVTVENGETTVREEVVRTTRQHGAVVWLAPEGYRFSNDGIVIQNGAAHFRCGQQANGRRFRCAKLQHVPGEQFKYDVNLIDERSGTALPTLDPLIIND